MKEKITIMFVILLSLGCSNNRSKNYKAEKTISIDSLIYYSKDKDIEIIRMKGDTLNLVTTNPFAYYPFGKFHNVNDFKNSLGAFEVASEKQYANNDTTLDLRELYNLSFNHSKIKVLAGPENSTIEIVSGIIIDGDIKLRNGFEIGITKDAVFDSLFIKKPDNYSRINTIELESGLLGIWHYYKFNNDILMTISFDTDYQFKK
jgi:hypothetical protein